MNFNKLQQNSRSAKLVRILVFIVLSYQVVQAEDYCSLCPNHIGCNNNGNFAASCSSDHSMVPMDQTQIQNILKVHNEKRDTIASGQLPGYDSAAKMPVLSWDSELARLAELNAKTCKFGHDECHATSKYPWSGQNIAIRGNSGGYEEKTGSIDKMVNDWFGEYKDANMNYIHRYPTGNTPKMIGHFTVMANDKNTGVGCAMSRFQSDGFKWNYLVCNYGYTNILGEQVYKSGRPASECKSKSPIYGSLCV